MKNTNTFSSFTNTHLQNRWNRFLGLSSLILVSGVVANYQAPSIFSQESHAPAIEAKSPQGISPEEEEIIKASEKASEAVVLITNLQKAQMQDNPFAYYFDPGSALPESDREDGLTPVGFGSGVVYRIDGDKVYIVTNHHVVEGSDALEIRLKNGETLKGKLVGSDELSDLAVITIQTKDVKTALEFVDSDQIKVGQTAIAVGNPLSTELSTTVTKGIISGLNRSVPVDTNGDKAPDWDMSLLQTDAAINQGNSGGALINSGGQLMGINSSKLSATGVEGMGFAIPSNDVIDIISQLEANGEVIRPTLGIKYTSLEMVKPEYRSQVMGLKEEDTAGAFVTEVLEGSAAEKAGLKAYDLIREVDGQKLEDFTDLRKALYQHKVGDKITLKILREDKEETIEVTLSSEVESIKSNPIVPF